MDSLIDARNAFNCHERKLDDVKHIIAKQALGRVAHAVENEKPVTFYDVPSSIPGEYKYDQLEMVIGVLAFLKKRGFKASLIDPTRPYRIKITGWKKEKKDLDDGFPLLVTSTPTQRPITFDTLRFK